MKQMKMMMVALTLLMGVAFTSCMDGGEGGLPGGTAIVQVRNYMGMTYFSAGDYKFTPTSASLAAIEATNKFNTSSTQVAYIAYEYDEKLPENVDAETSKKMTVTLKFAVSLDATVNVTTPGASNDSIATLPIKGLAKDGISSTEDFGMVDNKYLLTGINYFLSTDKVHTFTLIYYPSETAADSEELKLYLRQRSQAKEEFSSSSTSMQVAGMYPSLYFHSFNIGEALTAFTRVTGKNPAKISITADVNENGTKLSAAEEKTYTIVYKPT